MSRLLWFFLGAGVSTWWLHKKNDCEFQRRIGPASAAMASPHPQMMNTPEQRATAYQPYQRDWEQERARVRDFSQNAGDAFVELSEATLTTIMQATEALKIKMAEHRVHREEERRMEDERRRNGPPRYV
ncbi:hypothetical protein C8R46DRAFT_1140123 [Mycena filopes]|nr:hypothetical protein C8R46DRAFT_1140123 [Mycena filopes]